MAAKKKYPNKKVAKKKAVTRKSVRAKKADDRHKEYKPEDLAIWVGEANYANENATLDQVLGHLTSVTKNEDSPLTKEWFDNGGIAKLRNRINGFTKRLDPKDAEELGHYYKLPRATAKVIDRVNNMNARMRAIIKKK